MQLGKYIGNDISKDDTHSNGLAPGTASSQSFDERQDIEKNRQAIASYRFSRLAQNYAPRGEYVRSKPRAFKKIERKPTRQEVNAREGAPHLGAGPLKTEHVQPRQRFQEPSRPTYNPYA